MELLTPQQTADFLQIAVITLQTWRALGTGPRFHRVGRQIRYNRADIEAWLAGKTEKKVTPLPEHQENKLSARDAAKFLGVRITVLANWRARGTGPQFEKDETGHVFYDVSELEAWKAKQTG